MDSAHSFFGKKSSVALGANGGARTARLLPASALFALALGLGLLPNGASEAWGANALCENGWSSFNNAAKHSVRCGTTNGASTENLIAIGDGSGTTNGGYATQGYADGPNAIGIGKNANPFTYGRDQQLASWKFVANSTAIGHRAHTHAHTALSIGFSTDSTGTQAIAIGSTDHNKAKAHYGARAAGVRSIALGDRALAVSNHIEYRDPLAVDGSGSPDNPYTSDKDRVNRAEDPSVTDAIAAGSLSWVQSKNAVALGGGLNKYGGLKDEGSGAVVANDADSAVAVGGAVSDAVKAAHVAQGVAESVALGAGSTALRTAGADGPGYDMSTNAAYAGADKGSPVWTSTMSAVAVGGVVPVYDETTRTYSYHVYVNGVQTPVFNEDGSAYTGGTPYIKDAKGKYVDASGYMQTRQITGVAAGTADTDAINVAQLKMSGFRTNANLSAADNNDLNHRLLHTWSVMGGMGSEFEASSQARISGYSGINLAAKAVQDENGNNTIHIQESESPSYQTESGTPVTVNTDGKGTINGLSNTYPITRRNYTPGQALTEDQLAQHHFTISANGKYTDVYGDETVFFVGDRNIHVDLGGSVVSIRLDRDLKVESVTIKNNGPRMDGKGIDMANRPITNLADAVALNDAVNKGQLDGMDDRMRAGVATAVALANVPMEITPGAQMVGAGFGWFRDQPALALGWSARSDNGRWVWRTDLGWNTEEVLVNNTFGFEF